MRLWPPEGRSEVKPSAALNAQTSRELDFADNGVAQRLFGDLALVASFGISSAAIASSI